MLPKRHEILQTCDHWIKKEKTFLVCILDLDDFFPVFEKFGTEKSQELFGQIALQIEKHLEAKEILGWIEGNAFLILSSHEVDSFVSRLLKAFDHLFEIDGTTHSLKASLGIALYPDHGIETRELLQQAEFAKHKAIARC